MVELDGSKVMKAPERLYLSKTIYSTYLYQVPDPDDETAVEYTRTDTFVKKAKEAFCKATCNGHPPRSTCTSLGTCREYDNFVKFLREE